ncbi:hypothetical protein AG1IA_07525 [Rhizoctonia solani AG-1 IA]|uniref:Uncharacterized protein n=1 Tax=Thanatephorus cucumeris (strain AG1-IA) TaxID=983506 RepID=L8WNU0_THACA|nr:hypothetical protein AG1IA_07525 [Rhizoctonia solani AG-1 IA]
MSDRFVVFVTIVPKTPEQQKDVIQLLHDVRPAWLALPGSLSHANCVGYLDSSPQGLADFSKIPEHDQMKEVCHPLAEIDANHPIRQVGDYSSGDQW